MFLIMGAIFVLSDQPGNSFDLVPFVMSDKLAHLVAYGTLAISVIYAFPELLREKKRRTVVIITIGTCFLYGCSDEFHQSFIPGRNPSVGDIIADTAGAVLVCSAWLFHMKRKKKSVVQN